MAALRSSTTSLKTLTKATTTAHTARRTLHMTGPAEFSSLLTTDKPTAAQLKAELDYQQKTADALEASAYHQAPIRHFNTSRSLKSVGDSSTIDFAYLPDFAAAAGDVEDGEGEGVGRRVRIPLLPAGLYESLTSYAKEAPEKEVMRPEIITTSADSTHISAPRAFSEVHDNTGVDISDMAQKVASAAGIRTGSQEDTAGMVSTIWKGMLEDLFGPKKTA